MKETETAKRCFFSERRHFLFGRNETVGGTLGVSQSVSAWRKCDWKKEESEEGANRRRFAFQRSSGVSGCQVEKHHRIVQCGVCQISILQSYPVYRATTTKQKTVATSV